jgi:formylglycine-generating enzyme required for sulfatase activity
MKFLNKTIPLQLIFFVGLILFFTDCSKTSVDVVVKTYHVTNISPTSGTIRGTATITGPGNLTMSGIVYSTTATFPTIDTCKYAVSASPSTDFSIVLSGLSTDSVYNFRAFARTADSVYYGYKYSFRPMSISIATATVKGGTFTMGPTIVQASDTNNLPTHSVTLSDFEIGKYEVTNAQYLLFLKSRFVPNSGYCMATDGKSHKLIYSNSKGVYYDAVNSSWTVAEGSENLPVTYVTWYGANEFCLWAGGNLPTEAQWEFAARGGNYSHGYLYSGSDIPGDVAWYQSNVLNQASIQDDLQIVGNKAPNELGIYDMSGNVWEWVFDWFDTYSGKAQTNPPGLTDDEADVKSITDKVRRGGCWADTDPASLRVSKRASTAPTLDTGSVGFRFAK